jgi:pimeloyl-ACP methyl ester carboxylesterase
MGLGGVKQTWQRQTKDFGHTEAEKYTCLIFDNRGMGESDKPILRYTTSEMARDVIELLEHVGWKDDRSVHVVGISMGGMIAQELVRLLSHEIFAS